MCGGGGGGGLKAIVLNLNTKAFLWYEPYSVVYRIAGNFGRCKFSYKWPQDLQKKFCGYFRMCYAPAHCHAPYPASHVTNTCQHFNTTYG